MTRPLLGVGQPLRAPRSPASLDLAMEPLRPGELKQAWIYRQVRDRILDGVLAKGARLPSTRHLAQRWEVSRVTVDQAYDQLRSEGYLVSAAGSGTYVAAQVPDRFVDAGASASKARQKQQPPPPLPKSGQRKPRRPPAPPTLTPAALPRTSEAGQPFIARVADPSLFPLDQWRKALQAAARRATAADLGDADPLGLAALRTQIAHYLGVARGIPCDPGQVIVLSGIRHGLDLCARLLLSAGDTVMVEDPGYQHAVPIFGRHAGEVLHVPVDAQGFSVAHARRHAVAPRLVHVTPAHQAPTGVTMPVSRRLELLAWAQEAGCWVIEDDYDSEFSYDHAPLPALKGLDEADRVIHCGSFNKTMFAGLRIGYAVLPWALVPRFQQARHVTGRSTGVIEQMALAQFLESGAFARQVRRARTVYARRRNLLRDALAQALGPARLHLTGEHAGFHMVWWPPPDMDAPGLQAAAAASGLHFQAVSEFCSSRHLALPPGLVLGYTALDDKALVRHARALCRLIPPPLP